MLGVKAETFARFGAVSAEAAVEMAEGALMHSRSDISVAITGMAGPEGSSEDKPVGTVWFAWAGGGRPPVAVCEHFEGDRGSVRRQAVETALRGLIERLAMKIEAEKSRLPRIEVPTQRLFFALWPSEEVRSGLAEVMASLDVRRAKPVAAENLHITLLFFRLCHGANTDLCRKDRRRDRGTPVRAETQSNRLLAKIGIVWLGAREVAGELFAALVRDLHLGIAGCGIDLDARPVKAHVTLMRKALVVRRERPPDPIAWRVDDFALVESKTNPDGAHYQVLTRWRLGADSRGAHAGLRGSSA